MEFEDLERVVGVIEFDTGDLNTYVKAIFLDNQPDVGLEILTSGPDTKSTNDMRILANAVGKLLADNTYDNKDIVRELLHQHIDLIRFQYFTPLHSGAVYVLDLMEFYMDIAVFIDFPDGYRIHINKVLGGKYQIDYLTRDAICLSTKEILYLDMIIGILNTKDGYDNFVPSKEEYELLSKYVDDITLSGHNDELLQSIVRYDPSKVIVNDAKVARYKEFLIYANL